MRRAPKIALSLAALPLMGMSCDPAWTRAARLTTQVNTDLPGPANDASGLVVSCPGPTLTVTNTASKSVQLSATYGPTQAPLVLAAPAGNTPIGPGGTYVVDLAPAVGYTALVFLDNGAVARLDVQPC